MSAFSVKPAASRQPLWGAHARSLDVRVGRPGLRSLPGRGAFALRAPLAARARSRARAPRRSSNAKHLMENDRGPGPSTEATPPDTAALIATATRRHDAANQHQRNDENLGFSSVRPQGKADRMSAFSVKPASQPAANRRSAARTRSPSTTSPVETVRCEGRLRRFEKSARCRWSR